MKNALAVTAAIMLLCLGGIARANITIDTVPVGDVGNQPDTRYGGSYGSVGYNYNIGKYEVTAGQYTAFLNAVAATDTYGLYDTGMSSIVIGSGITRGGVSGSYTYSVDDRWFTDFINRPVNYVSWGDCARFANWLHNGQGNGDTETGAYNLSGGTVQRNPGAKWFVPSEDEWYKAAYYKGGGTNAGYWDYPTSSDTAPGRDMADASGNNANYYTGSGPFPICNFNRYTTVAGEFQNSDSPYGTFDQGGNVYEYNEAGGFRGGSFSSDDDSLHASNLSDYHTPPGGREYGFRVAQAVPEPSSIVALAGGLASLLAFKRRKACT